MTTGTKLPTLYLSTSDGQWRVILQGSPQCADTDYRTAVKIYEEIMAYNHRALVSPMPVWDGDIAQFR